LQGSVLLQNAHFLRLFFHACGLPNEQVRGCQPPLALKLLIEDFSFPARFEEDARNSLVSSLIQKVATDFVSLAF
jgi:hypothetical protein